MKSKHIIMSVVAYIVWVAYLVYTNLILSDIPIQYSGIEVMWCILLFLGSTLLLYKMHVHWVNMMGLISVSAVFIFILYNIFRLGSTSIPEVLLAIFSIGLLCRLAFMMYRVYTYTRKAR